MNRQELKLLSHDDLIDLVLDLSNSVKQLQSLVSSMDQKIQNQQKIIEQQQKVIEEQQKTIEKQQKKISHLEEKASKNSSNSSKPPSTDQKSNTRGKDKKPRKGNSRKNSQNKEPRKNVDQFVNCEASCCPNCQSAELTPLKKTTTTQQYEIPSLLPSTLTEYRRRKYCCRGCKNTFYAKLPGGIANGKFGVNLTAYVCSMLIESNSSTRQVISHLKSHFALTLSLGTIVNMRYRASDSIESAYEEIEEEVFKSSDPKYLDETGWRIQGKTSWLWTASSVKATFLKVLPGRSKLDLLDFTKNLSEHAILVSDRYSVYIGRCKTHQYCLAHLIRTFRGFSEREGPEAALAESVKLALQKACRIESEFREGKITAGQRGARLRYAEKETETVLLNAFSWDSGKMGDLSGRLLDGIKHLFAFRHHLTIQPTNNEAERSLRHSVINRKITQGSKSLRGASSYSKMCSVYKTCKKTGSSFVEFLAKSLESLFGSGKSVSFHFSS